MEGTACERNGKAVKKSLCVLKGLLWSLTVKAQEWKRGINFTSGLMGVKGATEVGCAALVPLFLKGFNIWRWGERHKICCGLLFVLLGFGFFLPKKKKIFTVWHLRSSVYLIFEKNSVSGLDISVEVLSRGCREWVGWVLIREKYNKNQHLQSESTQIKL